MDPSVVRWRLNKMRKIFVFAAAAALLATAACNTVAGVGRDTSAAGDAVTGAAHEAQH